MLCWDDAPAAFLVGMVAYPNRLLGHLLWLDVERPHEGPRLQQGVSKDRILWVHDPELCRERQSRSQGFDGYKAAVSVNPQSQLITAVAVLPANTLHAREALALVDQSEEETGLPVTEGIANATCGDGHTHQAF